jgi:hypothetical protein
MSNHFHKRAIENNACLLINKTWTLYQLRQEAYAQADFLKRNRAARVIQRARLNAILRAERRAARIAPMWDAAANELQRVFRGIRVL